MKMYDFGRSFVTFGLDFSRKPPRTVSHKPPYSVNTARLQIACACEIEGPRTNGKRTYVLSESCKTEIVGPQADIFTDPNADMCMVACEEEFMVVKSWARRDMGVMLEPASLGPQPERQAESVEDVFTEFGIHLHPVSGRVLDRIEDVVERTVRNALLFARIEYEENGYRVRIDHPVKTMNVNGVNRIYQTDTGPLILPDLSESRLGKTNRFIEVFDHAFGAFNSADWAEFVINVPTELTDEISVNHYSRSRRVEGTRNMLVELLR